MLFNFFYLPVYLIVSTCDKVLYNLDTLYYHFFKDALSLVYLKKFSLDGPCLRNSVVIWILPCALLKTSAISREIDYRLVVINGWAWIYVASCWQVSHATGAITNVYGTEGLKVTIWDTLLDPLLEGQLLVTGVRPHFATVMGAVAICAERGTTISQLADADLDRPRLLLMIFIEQSTWLLLLTCLIFEYSWSCGRWPTQHVDTVSLSGSCSIVIVYLDIANKIVQIATIHRFKLIFLSTP